jgi:hypothetical protein
MILFTSFMRSLPSPLTLLTSGLCLIVLFGCTTIQNRRDLYFPQTVEGPYTRMLHHRLATPSPTPVLFPKGTGETGSGKNVIKPRG